MNLADANLKHVNTSRPQLIHSQSKQSITASDDYYSLTSEGSSNEGKKRGQQYETPPPPQPQSQLPTQSALQSEATIPPVRAIKHTQQGSDTSEEKPTIPPRSPEHRIKRKPVSTSSDNTLRRPLSEAGANDAPTPGDDDAPYVRYAIDSLTRDERSYYQRPTSETYPKGLLGHNENLDDHHPKVPQDPFDPLSSHPASPALDHALLPADPIGTEAFRYPKLNYVPRALRIIPLSILIICCLLMMAALIFCAIWPGDHQGLFTYDGTSTSRYFVFQYLPQLLAGMIVLWLSHLQSAVHRIFPFATMASAVDEPHTSGALHDAKLFRTNYLIPDLTYFKYREPVLGVCALIFWLALFTIPLQSSLFQSKYYPSDDIWRWTTVVPIAWALFTIYLLLAVALLLLLLRFALYQTGLKWDPVCLADIMVIFRGSNVLSDFETSEIDPSALRRQRPKSLRIGYWKTSRRDSETFYCIGDQAAPLRRYSLERGKLRSVDDESAWMSEGQHAQKSATFETLQSDIHEPSVRYRWLPWFLKDTFVVLWVVIAIVLLIAFLVVSYLHGAVSVGFLPLLPAPTTSAGFSPADFLYSFLPSFLGLLLYLLWQPIDQYHRALAPFAALSTPHGVSAEESILLDYNAQPPFQMTLIAAIAGHYRLAWISFVSVFSLAIPILGGGVFTALFSVPTQSVRMTASRPGYTALTVFLVIYAFSFLMIWPREKRRLPHDISTLGQLVSYFYRSPLLGDPTFKEPRGKIDLVTRLLGAPAGETMSARYAFAVYKGTDGRDHLGIDRFERPVISEKVARGSKAKRQTDWIGA